MMNHLHPPHHFHHRHRRVQHHFRVHRLPSLLLLQQADALPALRTLRQVLRRPLPAVHSRSSTHENESTTGVQDLGFEVWDVLSESQFSASTTFKSLKCNPIPAPKPKAGEEFADALFTELVPWGKDQTFTGLTHGTPSPASNVKISFANSLSLSLSLAWTPACDAGCRSGMGLWSSCLFFSGCSRSWSRSCCPTGGGPSGPPPPMPSFSTLSPLQEVEEVVASEALHSGSGTCRITAPFLPRSTASDLK